MLVEFYNKAGLSRKKFYRWAKELTKGFVRGVDYEIINGKFSFEPTAKLVVVLRLKERYPKDFTNHDIYQALAEASIKIKPSSMLEDKYSWPSIVHCVHVIWHSRRKDKLAEVGDNEVDKEYLTVAVDENDDIVLSAPKILLPEADFIGEESTQPKQEDDVIVEESTPTIQPRQEDDDFEIEVKVPLLFRLNKETMTLTLK